MLRIEIIGGFSIRGPEGAVELRSRKARALIALLAMAPGMRLPRQVLCDTLWGSRAPAQARGSLRQELAALRRRLGAAGCDPVAADAEQVALLAGRVATDAGRLFDEATAPQAALALATGPLLGGLSLKEPAFDDWLAEARRRVEDRIVAVARDIGRQAQAASDWAGLDRAGQGVLACAPYDEEAVRWRMQSLAERGRRAEALEAYRAFAGLLRTELDIPPAPETRALADLLAGDAPNGAAAGKPAKPAMPAPGAGAAVRPVLRRPAVLFLPFEALSRSEKDALLALGLCEDIRTSLSSWRSFPVIGPEALGAARGDVQGLAASVDAAYVVTGSVRRAGDRARVTARLIDAPRGRELWSQGFDGDLSDIFDFHDQISRRIASQIEPEITSAAAARVPVARPRDMTVWELLVKVVDAERRGGDGYGTRAAHDTQKALLAEVLRRDPASCEARARLARCHIREFLLKWTDDLSATLAEALAASSEAVRIDPQNSYARAVRSLSLLFGTRDPVAALDHAQEAVRLNPSNVVGHIMMGCVLAYYGEPERGFEHFEHVNRLNPNYPNQGTILCDQMMCRALAGRFDEAVQLAHRVMAVAPDYYRGLQRCAAVMAQAGDAGAARAILARVETIGGAFDEAYVRETYPFARPQDLDFLLTGLRKAGWPG